MKKLLFFSTLESSPWGGSEQLWSDMALNLFNKGHNVMTNTITHSKTPNKINQLREAGLHISFRPNPHKSSNIADSANNKVLALKWKTDVLEFNPDIIFINQGGSFDNALLQHSEWIQSLNKPIYILCQFMSEYDYLDDDSRNHFKNIFSQAKNVWFVSNRNKEVVERVLAQKLDNGIVIKNPIKLNKTTSKYPTNECYNMAAVARLEVDVKGYDILFSVLSEPQWSDRNFKLNIYGSGKHEEYIKELVQYFQLEHCVEFKGFVQNIVTLWEENHILLMPSRGEGTPLSLLEANYCKRTAVVTDVGGNADIIEEGYNGYVAEAPAISCFSNALERAWDDKKDWQQLGLNAKTKIESLYTSDAISDAIEMLGI